MRRIPLVLALGGLLVLGGGASGETTTSWSRVTDPGARNIDEVGLARTKDDVLHVVWRTLQGSTEKLRHAAIEKNGEVGAAGTAVAGIRGVSNPDLAFAPDGSLQMFYSAVQPSPGGIRMSQSSAAGTSWSGPARVSFDTQGGPPGVALRGDGTPVIAWAASTKSWFHVGTNPGEPDVALGPSPRCCYYSWEVAVEGDRALGAYFSLASGEPGIFVRQLMPTLGTPQLAPQSLTGGKFVAPDHRTPLVARDGGGSFVAYCSGYPRCTKVLLWRVGGRVLKVGKGRDIEDVNLARGHGGRLWVMWQDAGRLIASRTNAAANRGGALVRVEPPPGTATVWDVFGEGSLGPLDLLAHVTERGKISTWHRQVLPGLTLSCAPKKTGATCRVTDAGDPVAGATVKIGAKSVKTLSSGTASFTLKKGTHKAAATKAGYAPAKAAVKVR